MRSTCFACKPFIIIIILLGRHLNNDTCCWCTDWTERSQANFFGKWIFLPFYLKMTGTRIATRKRVKCTRMRENWGVLITAFALRKFRFENYCWNQLWSPKCEVVPAICFKSVSFFENENLRTDNQATPFSSLTNFISKSERTS